MSPTTGRGHAPVLFDEEAWSRDLANTSDIGRQIARATRREFERYGCPVDTLRRCETDGRDGTHLPGCVKTYLPQPAGRFGMVFEIVRGANGLKLLMLAFGVRHHPHDANAMNVYELADYRLRAL